MAVTVGGIALGCAKNLVDMELMLAEIKNAGIEITSEYSSADIVVINTCGFLEDAKKEAIENILEVAALKNEGRVKKIIVTGCLAERYKNEIAEEFPEVDAFLGTGSYLKILQAIKEVGNGKRYTAFDPKEEHNIDGQRLVTTPSYTAYLKISEGCDNCCSYCAIPLIRGRFRSRTMESILAEAETLAENGVKELNIISQDTTRYGEDLYGSYMLPELLKRLSQIEKLHWIRILYTYPEKITDELLDEIASNPKVVKYIDMPVQHASGRVLHLMNRKGDRQSLENLIAKMRSKISGLTLRSTIIVGFPMETDEDFSELCEFVKSVRFERLGVFCFSQEEGTKAYSMDGQIDEEVKQNRQEVLLLEQARISEEIMEKQIGRTFEVLTEGYDKYVKLYFGRSAADAPDVDGKVFFSSKKKLSPGDFTDVTITGSMEYDLMGEANTKS